MSRDLLKRLDQPTLVALRCKGEDWPRAVLSRAPVPDGWMALTIKPDGQRQLVCAGQDPHSEHDDTVVLVRDRPLAVVLVVTDVPAVSGHPTSATVELVVRCGGRDHDLAALHRALLATSELDLGRLAEAIAQAGARVALHRFIREHEARRLIHEEVRDTLLERLREELKRFLFSAGLVLEGLGKVEFSSPSLTAEEKLERETARRVREIEARRRIEQAALAAAERRLDELSGILGKLKAAADEALRWRQLLPVLTPAERGRLLENLWRLTPSRSVASALVLVVGQECLWVSPQEPDRIVRKVTLPEDLGGLRSVRFDPQSNILLIGAATGIWGLDVADGSVRAKYAVPNAGQPRTGFNAAAVVAGRLLATHSELGAWLWSLEDPAQAQPVLRPADGRPRTVRSAVADGQGHILFATDNRVQALRPTGQVIWESWPADAAIHCLAPLEGHLYAGTAGGELLRCDLGSPDRWLALHRAPAAIESITARRWDDLTELVIPAGPQGVCAVYAEEGLVARLLEASVPVRRAWACDDTLVALSEGRDRLIVLNGAMPARTGREVPIARQTGRSIQDACIVTVPESVDTKGPAGTTE